MSYNVNHTDTHNNTPIIVQDQTVENSSTSLTFVGKNYPGYARPLAENFLHLLENFANSTSPAHPTKGQLWYDSSNNQINVYDSTNWIPVGGIKKDKIAPSSAILGDLWIDTTSNQLKLFANNSWVLIGPNYSSGAKSGPLVETIVDTANIQRTVVSMMINDVRIAIICDSAFIPKSTIEGFTSLGAGVNIRSDALFLGKAKEASALSVNNVTVDSKYFLRSDITSTTDNPFNVRNNGGLSIGSDLNFNISTSSDSIIMNSRASGHSIDVRLNGSVNGTGESYSLLRLNADGKIGIGHNNTSNLNAVLNVSTDGYPSGTTGIYLNGPFTSTGKITVTSGGLQVTGDSSLGNVTSSGTVQAVDYIVSGSVKPTADGTIDIGLSTKKFNAVYAKTFYGDVIGTYSGNATSADKLRYAQSFSLSGDIETNSSVSFDGSNPVVLQTSCANSLIENKPQTTTTLTDDFLLLLRTNSLDPGLKKIRKAEFVNSFPVVPVGTILPFAGETAPSGFLFCRGQSVSTNTYPVLYSIIGVKYSNPIESGKFSIPDLRGRFPLGFDDRAGSGNAAIRPVGDVASTIVGSTGPSNIDNPDERTILLENLPAHKHDLKDSQNRQFYAINANQTFQNLTDNQISVKYHAAYENATFMPTTGNITSVTEQKSINIMNPFLTINYIIRHDYT